MTFSATNRSIFLCRALYTAPMPPWPSSFNTSYRGWSARSAGTSPPGWCMAAAAGRGVPVVAAAARPLTDSAPVGSAASA